MTNFSIISVRADFLLSFVYFSYLRRYCSVLSQSHLLLVCSLFISYTRDGNLGCQENS